VNLRLQAVIFIKVRADFGGDKAAAGLEVVVPMPREVQRVSCEYEQDVQPIGNQSWDWQEKQHRLVWKHKKVKGGTEWTLRVRHESRMHCITRSALLHDVTFGRLQSAWSVMEHLTGTDAGHHTINFDQLLVRAAYTYSTACWC